MQRRRKRKAEPRNVFGSGSQPKTSKKESVRSKERLTKPKIQPLPPPVPGLKPKPSVIPDPPLPEPEADAIAEPIVLVDQTPKAEDSSSTVVLEEQLLGDSPRRPLGLSKSAPAPEPEVIERISTTSEKAKELIESSKARASAHVETPPKSNAPAANALPKPQIKPRRKFRSRVRS